MSSQHSYCGGMKLKIFAKREQTIVFQRGEDFIRTNANKNLRHSLEEIFFSRTRTNIFFNRSRKVCSHEREQKSSTLARKKLIDEEN